MHIFIIHNYNYVDLFCSCTNTYIQIEYKHIYADILENESFM